MPFFGSATIQGQRGLRQPLRFQILLPMASVMLVTLGAVSMIDAWLAARRTRAHIVTLLQDVSRTLSETSFPLTPSVLVQMRRLSGAEFVVATPQGRWLAASYAGPSGQQQLPAGLADDVAVHTVDLQRRVVLNGQSYFHAVLGLHRPLPSESVARLHVLYPVSRYRQAQREAVMPPVIVGSISLLLVMLTSRYVTARITRPIFRLRNQVDRIAGGNFVPVTVTPRNDEIRDLSTAINHMVQMLAQYERQVRREEQLRTLGRLGGGMAHQVRNALTGCRMALELHRADCSMADDETLRVALRQIDLLEGSVKRFLSMSGTQSLKLQPLDLVATVEHVLPLVSPQAKHAGIELTWQRPDDSAWVSGDADALLQVLVNLLLNAMDAAQHPSDTHQPTKEGRVFVRVEQPADADHCVLLEIWDNGPGPDAAIEQQLFQPFVSTKREGVGLGLCVAQEIVSQHGGRIYWQRRDEMTCFAVQLPRLARGRVAVATQGEA